MLCQSYLLVSKKSKIGSTSTKGVGRECVTTKTSRNCNVVTISVVWRKSHEEIHNLLSFINVIKMMKSLRMIGVACSTHGNIKMFIRCFVRVKARYNTSTVALAMKREPGA
jgi:hypothetical protein